MNSSQLILANLCVYSNFSGMKLVASQPGICTHTHFLPICTKDACLYQCRSRYGWRTWGECKNLLTCRCHFECPAKDGNIFIPQVSPLTSKPNFPYPPHRNNPKP